MSEDHRTVIEELRASQKQVVDTLQSAEADPSWRPAPGEWSFAEIAAHLATVEEECFRQRIERIAAGEGPHFEYYSNTGRDFSQLEMVDSLRSWIAARRGILEFLRSLPQDHWSRTGTHATFGEITVMGAVEIMLDHDREHLGELQEMVAERWSGSAA